jgi:hypothetical protein
VAWRAGYDKTGAAQLSHRVVGTKKWVGTTECAALLRYFGLSAQIVDFMDAKGRHAPGRLRPRLLLPSTGSKPM